MLSPLNVSGDREGARWQEGDVLTASCQRQAYGQFVEGGWNAPSCDPAHGGQGLPRLVSALVEEMWNGANVFFGLCLMLTRGAIEALELRGCNAQKQLYLPNMVSGEWTSAMNLTEPQAGSDLTAVRTQALPQADGNYGIHGQKIFITYGEHDLTDNIVHLVLARTPDAPEGVKGISLFVVPKFLVNDDGSPAAQRRALRVDRAQAGHPRQPDRGAGLRRQGRRDRLAGRRGEPRPRNHVHHDERGTLLGRAGRHQGPGPFRSD